jgi:hypothetical protein
MQDPQPCVYCGKEVSCGTPGTGDVVRLLPCGHSACASCALMDAFDAARDEPVRSCLCVCLVSCVGEARNRPGLLAHGGGWARGAAARCVACARAKMGSVIPREGGVGMTAPIYARAHATQRWCRSDHQHSSNSTRTRTMTDFSCRAWARCMACAAL